MRFATVTANGTQLYGVERDDGFVALSPDFPQWKTLRNVIEAGALKQLAQAAQGRPATHAPGSYTYDIPVPDPEKIIL